MLKSTRVLVVLGLFIIGCANADGPSPYTVPAPEGIDEWPTDAGIEDEPDDAGLDADLVPKGDDPTPVISMPGDTPAPDSDPDPDPEAEPESDPEAEAEPETEEPETCVPSSEICNDIDDDCDGRIDEGGVCVEEPEACLDGFEDCDGNESNGCEQSLSTPEHCGACGNSCGYDNATSICSDGGCAFVDCQYGHSDCDGTLTNGCEVSHFETVNACGSTALDVGSSCSDEEEGFWCSDKETWTNVATASGNRSQWFKFTMTECSNCDADLRNRLRLFVPDGVDYDLYVYRGCGTLAGSSREGLGVDESLVITEADDSYGDDNLTYYVRVVYEQGVSNTCGAFTLYIDRPDYD